LPQAQGQSEDPTCAVGLALGRHEQLLYFIDGVRLHVIIIHKRRLRHRSALLTGRHAIRSGTQTVDVTGGPDGMTRWEVTIAQALSDAGYATGMWGKWHLGSNPEQRSPVDFGFDEAVWSPRTADEVLWTMQSYFPMAQ
jgi:arylsulfatase